MTPNSDPARPEGLRERNKREKLTRIKRAARQLFEKKGFEAATAREICRRARIGTGTLFLYVRDKRELLFLVFRDEARRLFAEGMARVDEEMALPEALGCLFGCFIEFYAGNPELSRVVVQELFFREHEPDGLGALTLEFGSHISVLVERAQKRGETRPDVPARVAASAFFAHYAFWVQAWLGTRLVARREAEEGLRNALELQLAGLRPRRQKRS